MKLPFLSAIRKGIWLVLVGYTISYAETAGISTDVFRELILFYSSMCEGPPVENEMDIPEIKEGKWVTFHDGKKFSTGECRKGKAEGVWLILHDHGGKAVEAFFREGKPEGVWRFWHYNGRKIREEEYQNGMRHGRFTMWSKYDGKEYISGTYKEDKQNGKWTYGDEKGGMEKEEVWESGTRISP